MGKRGTQHLQSCSLLQAYGKEADVFSFGVVLWELVTLERPWREEPEPSLPSAGPGDSGGAAGGDGNAALQHFRDPLLYVIASVPHGGRLDLPCAGAIEPPLPELPKVRAGCCQPC